MLPHGPLPLSCFVLGHCLQERPKVFPQVGPVGLAKIAKMYLTDWTVQGAMMVFRTSNVFRSEVFEDLLDLQCYVYEQKVGWRTVGFSCI